MSRVSPENRLIGFSPEVLSVLQLAQTKARKNGDTEVKRIHVLTAIQGTHRSKSRDRAEFHLKVSPNFSSGVKDAIVIASDIARKGTASEMSLEDFRTAWVSLSRDKV